MTGRPTSSPSRWRAAGAGGRRRVRLPLGGRARGAGSRDPAPRGAGAPGGAWDAARARAASIPRGRSGPGRPCGGGRSGTWRLSHDPAFCSVLHRAAGGRGAHAVGGVARARRRSRRGPAAGARRPVRIHGRRRHLVAQPARRAPRAAGARGRRGRRRGGLVGLVAGGGARPALARRAAGLGARRPAAAAAGRGGAGAHPTRAPGGRGHAGAVPAAAPAGGLGRRPRAHRAPVQTPGKPAPPSATCCWACSRWRTRRWPR